MILVLSKPDPGCISVIDCMADLTWCCVDLKKALLDTLKEEKCEYDIWESVAHVVVRLKKCRGYDWISDFRPYVTVVPDSFFER